MMRRTGGLRLTWKSCPECSPIRPHPAEFFYPLVGAGLEYPCK